MAALVDAAAELIIEQGLNVTVRQIAAQADVNHGLVHIYFGNKRTLLSAAFDEINRRAGAESSDAGYPPPSLANHRGGELAKAVARLRLEAGEDLFSSHPVTDRWRQALLRDQPELNPEQVDTMVASATALGLGWALFADHLSDLLGLDDRRRSEMEGHMTALIAELGGIPTTPPD